MNLESSLVEMQQDIPDVSTRQLEGLFSQKMHLSDSTDQGPDQPNPSAPVVEQAQQVEQQQPPIKYSMSQHYTHSSHVVRGLHPLQPSSEDLPSRMLIKNGIAPSSLLRAQLSLFEQADEDQRSRLIELWTIVPPTYARNGGQELADRLGEYQNTTLAQEQELALLRYQKNGLGGNVQSGVQAEQPKSLPGDFFMQSSGEGLQPTINQYFSATKDRSIGENGSWSEDLNQRQMEHQHGNCGEKQQFNEQPPQGILACHDMEDEEML
ncbi:hypothetical protein ABVK25_003084 [Lepraria finkii]|uniref:Uncharacterized protein n=1 Tax=Lepraria finkii TaxID=1340010 RepID=A0ABR4BFS3_9LECA